MNNLRRLVHGQRSPSPPASRRRNGARGNERSDRREGRARTRPEEAQTSGHTRGRSRSIVDRLRSLRSNEQTSAPPMPDLDRMRALRLDDNDSPAMQAPDIPNEAPPSYEHATGLSLALRPKGVFNVDRASYADRKAADAFYQRLLNHGGFSDTPLSIDEAHSRILGVISHKMTPQHWADFLDSDMTIEEMTDQVINFVAVHWNDRNRVLEENLGIETDPTEQQQVQSAPAQTHRRGRAHAQSVRPPREPVQATASSSTARVSPPVNGNDIPPLFDFDLPHPNDLERAKAQNVLRRLYRINDESMRVAMVAALEHFGYSPSEYQRDLINSNHTLYQRDVIAYIANAARLRGYERAHPTQPERQSEGGWV